MEDSDRDLIRHVLDGQAELGKSVYELHGVVATHNERSEQRHEQLKNTIDIFGEQIAALGKTREQVEEWKSYQKLGAWVLGVVGVSGVGALLRFVIAAK